MTPQEIEQLTKAILNIFEAGDSRFGLQVQAVSMRLGPFGFDHVTNDEVQQRIEILTEANKFLQPVNKEIGKANRAWRITPEGMQFLEDNGF